MTHPRRTRPLLACGVLAGPQLLLVVLIDGATRPGYQAWLHGVSQLGLTDRGWITNLAFITSGLLLLAYTAGVRHIVHTGSSTWGPRFLAATATGLIIAGAVPTDPALGYPPGAPEQANLTLAAGIHQIGGALLFVGLVGACITWGRRFAQQHRLDMAAYSLGTGVIIAATALGAGIVYRLIQRDVISDGPAGALELASFIVGFAWITTLAVTHAVRTRRDRVA